MAWTFRHRLVNCDQGPVAGVYSLGFANQYVCIYGADVLIICTEWSVFRSPDFQKIAEFLNNKLIFDGRNLFDPKKMDNLGFEYHCVGRNVRTDSLID